MAYFKITQNKKGELQAKIQVSGKDVSTGKSKVFTKRVYNTDESHRGEIPQAGRKDSHLLSKRRCLRAYRDGKDAAPLEGADLCRTDAVNGRRASKSGLSVNYYERAEKVEHIFGEFLEQNGLADKPISAITVRDVQRFLSSFTTSGV